MSLTDTLDLSIANNGDKGDVITVEVTPNDGHADGTAATDFETVANTAPVIISVTAIPDPVDEGSSTLVTVSATDDDGDALTYEFDCTNDGTYDFGPQTQNDATCTYDDGPDGHVIGVRVTDTSGDSDTATEGVTVTSVAPSGDFDAQSPVFEGSPSTLSWTDVTDPSTADTLAGFHYSYACSGLIGDLIGDYALASPSSTSTCTFYDNDWNPSTAIDDAYPVASSVIDKDNASTTTGDSVTVLNVAPTLSNVTITGAILENGTATLTGTIFDPGTLDSFTLVVTWGDGYSNTFTYAAGTTSFTETHQYLDDNRRHDEDIYYGGLTLTDDDGDSDTDSTSVTVSNVAPLTATNLDSPINENDSDPDRHLHRPGHARHVQPDRRLGRGRAGRYPLGTAPDLLGQPPVPR